MHANPGEFMITSNQIRHVWIQYTLPDFKKIFILESLLDFVF